ncbi:MAG TPA: patatin-like phospholipase family protein [Sphingobium sp.]|uniref:patatin-like phospholipase family protein n=1 Tax=Sphingobium sp. TaxID=1912891 RepID=UPI002ED30F00
MMACYPNARLLLAAALSLLLSACATDRPLETACPALERFTYPHLGETPPPEATPAPVATASVPGGSPLLHRGPITLPYAANDNEPPTDSMDRALQQAYQAPDNTAQPVQPRYSDALILSGGGQWGAYGAGVLSGWSIHGRLPARIVTGISTGALQATFAYLGDDKGLVEAYSIKDERQLAIRYGNGFFLRHASTADIAPLKSYIRERVGPLIPAVAAEYRQSGRTLLVGAVDGLTGQFHVIDLTKIAVDSKLTDAQRLDCYSAGLLASAAVPVIFRQVSINGRPWLDGGVRHALFLPEIIRRISAARTANARAGYPSVATDGTVWAVKNGVTSIDELPALPAQLLPTILRLRTIVFDEIEANSLDLAAYQASKRGLRLYAATADGWDKSGLPECRDVKPGVEDAIFDPAFMRCLLSYGEGRWLNGKTPWVLHEPS